MFLITSLEVRRDQVTIDQPTPEELAYLAGIIDGEGHVLANRKGIGLVLCMADIPILEWVSERFSGSLSNRWQKEPGKARPRRMWHLTRAADLDFLLPQLLPYLVLKGPEVEIVLEMAKLSLLPRPDFSGRHHPSWYKRREELRLAKRAATQARKSHPTVRSGAERGDSQTYRP